MCNYASLELCKELYELSGWPPVNWYVGGDAQNTSLLPELTLNEFYRAGKLEPAYDLGYLLRKLPQPRLLQVGDYWECYSGGKPADAKWGETPENAACKLAIELIQQGVIDLVSLDSKPPQTHTKSAHKPPKRGE